MRRKIHINEYESLNGYKIEKALDILIEEINYIRYVKDWADKFCVSYEWLKKNAKRYFGKSPKVIMREVRYETIIFLIKENGWESTSKLIAYKSGVGTTSDSLYKFLKVHYNTTFTRLKKEVLTKRYEINFVWLTSIESKNLIRYRK